MHKFYTILKELRSEKGLTQEELAQKLGIRCGTYCKWEQNRANASYEDLIKLADFYQVSVDYLIGHTDDLGNVTVITTQENTLNKNERTLLSQFKKLTDIEKNLILKQISAWTENK